MSCCGGTGAFRPEERTEPQPAGAREDPLTILAERLARGEITVEEYERIRAVLARDGAPATRAPQPGRRHGGCC